MTRTQKVELMVILEEFKDNLSRNRNNRIELTDTVHRRRIANLENTVVQILSILTEV